MPEKHGLLAFTDLYLRRGERELYGGLGGRFDSGDICWLRGENGRGKTTLLRILAGLITPESGQVYWRGREFAARLDEARQAISFLDERLGLCRDLTVEQNLRFACAAGAGGDVATLLEDLALAPLAQRPLRQLSTGQKKRVGLGRILAEGSLVWLLDEPANGLDAGNRTRLADLIRKHAAAGGLCLYASHEPLPLDGVIEMELP